MLRLTKLEIRKFDGVEPTTLTFGPGFNVLLGKNATGKTTLLEIIAAIIGDHFETLSHRSQEIDIAYELSTAAGPMSVELEVHPPVLAMDQVLEFDAPIASAETREVRVSGRAADREFDFASGGGGIIDSVSQQPVKVPASLIWTPRFLMVFAVWKAPAAAFKWRVANDEGRLDEGLRVWDRWLGSGEASNVLRHVTIDAIGHTMATGAAPGVLRDVFAEAAEGALPREQLKLEATKLAPLRQAVELFGLRDARLTYTLRSSDPIRDRGWSAYYSGALTFERHDGSVFPADWLSFGQKRMLTFLLYEASTRGTPAVLDELVNGLHYEWVELCVEKLRDRQSFVTAQNPLILDLLGFESVEQVRETFVQCARVDGRMAWTNFTEAQAKAFYEAYEVGIQHVHEVLRDQGLW